VGLKPTLLKGIAHGTRQFAQFLEEQGDLRFQIELFGKQSTGQRLKITVSRKSDGQEHVFELKPVTSAGILFANKTL
jgi:hypothetical protein